MTPDYAATAHRKARRDRHRPATAARPWAIPQRVRLRHNAGPSPFARVASFPLGASAAGRPAKAAYGDTSLREQRTELLAVPLVRTRSPSASTPTRSAPKSLLRASPATGGTQSCRYHRRPAHAVDQALANGSANEPGSARLRILSHLRQQMQNLRNQWGGWGSNPRRIMSPTYRLAGLPACADVSTIASAVLSPARFARLPLAPSLAGCARQLDRWIC